MKRIVITGSTSPIAVYLAKELCKKNEILTVGRREAEIIYDFLGAEEALNLPEDVDTIIHMAAAVSEDTDYEILNMLEVNIKGTLKTCIAANQYGVRHFINISSASATLLPNSPFYSYYSITKKQAEEIGEYYCKTKGIKYTSIRPSQVYGPDKKFGKHQPLLYQMIKNAEKGMDTYIYGKNDAYRNYIYIEDLVNIMVSIIECGLEGIYPIVYPINYRLSEIAEAAFNAFGNGGRVIFQKEKKDIPDKPFYYQGQIYKILNIEPTISIQEGMKLISNKIQNH